MCYNNNYIGYLVETFQVSKNPMYLTPITVKDIIGHGTTMKRLNRCLELVKQSRKHCKRHIILTGKSGIGKHTVATIFPTSIGYSVRKVFDYESLKSVIAPDTWISGCGSGMNSGTTHLLIVYDLEYESPTPKQLKTQLSLIKGITCPILFLCGQSKLSNYKSVLNPVCDTILYMSPPSFSDVHAHYLSHGWGGVSEPNESQYTGDIRSIITQCYMNQVSGKDDGVFIYKHNPKRCIPKLFHYTTPLASKCELFFYDPESIPMMIFYNYMDVKIKIDRDRYERLGTQMYDQAVKRARRYAKKNKLKRIKKPIVTNQDQGCLYKLHVYSSALEWMGDGDIFYTHLKQTQDYNTYYPIMSGCVAGACSSVTGIVPEQSKVRVYDPIYYTGCNKKFTIDSFS